MATGDFAWLKLQLAYMAGRSSVAQLDEDATLAGQVVNEAYLNVYLPPPSLGDPNPGRPGFAKIQAGIQLRAPITQDIVMTSGAQAFTGNTFPSDTIGSIVQVGTGYYTLATTTTFLEPFNGTSGTYSATLWHSSYPLTANIVEVEEAPVVLGWGVLSPMASRAEDFRWRQIIFGDFFPKPGAGAYFPTGMWPGGINYPTGNPMFYRIENAPLSSTAAIQCLFLVEPMPVAVTNVQLIGWRAPVELSADADLPIMPANLITRVLLPLCREKWAKVYKKYAGANLGSLTEEANQARAVLNRISSGQQQRPIRTPLRNC